MSAQLDLFAAPKKYRLGGGPPSVQDAWERGFSPAVKDELVARLNERIGHWLEWRDYADIRERHKIGCCLGHILFSLAHEGRVIRKEVYFGATRPGLPEPYLGFKSVHSTTLQGPPAP